LNASCSSRTPCAPAARSSTHQRAPDAARLRLGVDGDRPDTAHRPALIEEVRADDAAVALGDDSPDRGVRRERPHEPGGGLGGREVAREAMAVVDAGEGRVEDARGRIGVVGADGAQDGLAGRGEGDAQEDSGEG
jgi:hypothetical protein